MTTISKMINNIKNTDCSAYLGDSIIIAQSKKNVSSKKDSFAELLYNISKLLNIIESS